MRTAATAIVLLFLVTTPGRSASAHDDVSLELRSVFHDDFRTEPGGDDTLQGDVAWTPGMLTLGEGASITREFRGGARVKVELAFNNASVASADDSTELRVWFLLDGATDCFVRLRTSPDGETGRAASLALLDTGERDGQLVSQLVRETPLPNGDWSRLTIAYRHGRVAVTAGELVTFTAYIQNGSAGIAGLRVQSAGGSHQLTGWTAACRPAPPTPTEEQQRLAVQATDLNQQLLALFREGRFAEAAELGERLLRLRESVSGQRSVEYSNSLNLVAQMSSYGGDYDRAETLHEQALEIRKSILGDQHPNYALSLNNLAYVCQLRGNYTRAETLYRECMAIERSVLGEQHPGFAGTLNNLADLYKTVGEFGRAEPLFRRAFEIHKAVLGEEDPSYATSLNNLAELYRSTGDYARAEPLHRKALEVRRSVLGPEHPDYAQSLHNLAALYASMGESARAEPLFREAMEIQAKSLGVQHPVYASTLNNLAGLYEETGAFTRAESLYSEALEIIESVLGERHPWYGIGLNNLACLYRTTGDAVRAEAYFRRALELQKTLLGEDHRQYARSLNNLAMLYDNMGHHARAEPLCLKAHAAISSAANRAVPAFSDARARAWMQKHRPRTDLVLTVLDRQKKWDSPDAYNAVWRTKLLISRLRVGQDPPPDSSPEALAAFTQLREARLDLARLVSAVPEPEQADQYRETLAKATERKESLEQRLARLNPASRRELAVRDATVADLLQQLPGGVAVIDFVQWDRWHVTDKKVTRQTDDGNAETRTVMRREAIPVFAAFVLRAERPTDTGTARWIRLGPAEPIERAVREWRRELTSASAASSTESSTDAIDAGSAADVEAARHPAGRLRRLIWDKLEPELQDCHTVILIPDGALHRLAWAALPGRSPNQYLIEDYALSTASSGQQLYGQLSAPSVQGEPRLLVAGGIRYDQRPARSADEPTSTQSRSATPGTSILTGRSRTLDVSDEQRQWGFLKGAAAELTAVTDLWKDRGPVQRLEGRAAGERALARLLPGSRYAHLATHGFFDTRGEVYRRNLRNQSLFAAGSTESRRGGSLAGRNPLLMTGVVMAGANMPPKTDAFGFPVGDDGILTAEEILGLHLQGTELVTLSACETGLGDVAAGEGVMGLTRALHRAGARSVLASLWKVHDRATQELMRRFYTNLWEHDMSKLDALRDAQLWMLRHPHELEAMGVTGAATRGLGSSTRRVDPATSSDETVERTDPYFWAAFQLSGDWR